MYFRTYLDKDTTIASGRLDNYGAAPTLDLVRGLDGNISRILVHFDTGYLEDMAEVCELDIEKAKHYLVMKPYRGNIPNGLAQETEAKICWSAIGQEWVEGCGNKICIPLGYDEGIDTELITDGKCVKSDDAANWFFAKNNQRWGVEGVFSNIELANNYMGIIDGCSEDGIVTTGGCIECADCISGNTMISGGVIGISGNCMTGTSVMGDKLEVRSCKEWVIGCDKCNGKIGKVVDGDIVCCVSGGCVGNLYCAGYENVPVKDTVESYYGGCVDLSCTDEYLRLDITEYVKAVLRGEILNDGLIISFSFDYELTTEGVGRYMGFYSKDTELFYKPYVETVYDNHIEDDRKHFYVDKPNKLHLFSNIKGNAVPLDVEPVVDIYDANGDLLTTLQSKCVGLGVYQVELEVSSDNIDDCVQWRDVWKGIQIAGKRRPDVELSFIIKQSDDYYQMGTEIYEPKHYKLSCRGVKFEEMIERGDVRKVFVDVVENFSHVGGVVDELYYKMYIKFGRDQLLIFDWTAVNRGVDFSWFNIDTRMLLPQTYYIGLKAINGGEVRTYQEIVKFSVTDKKDFSSTNMGGR